VKIKGKAEGKNQNDTSALSRNGTKKNTTTNKDSTNKEQMFGQAQTFSNRSLLLDHVWP